MRAVLASILKHEGLVDAARSYASADDTRLPPSKLLQLAYKAAGRVKRALLMLHQTRSASPEFDYDALSRALLLRCQLLLRVNRHVSAAAATAAAAGGALKRSLLRNSLVQAADALSPAVETLVELCSSEVPAQRLYDFLITRRKRMLFLSILYMCMCVCIVFSSGGDVGGAV